MAMTKKEQAAFQAAIDRAETLAALRWTAPVARDLPPPKDGYTQGWDISTYGVTIFEAWSGCVSHGTGKAPLQGKYQTASQNSRSLFSTRSLALAALRHEIEKECAAKLLKVDRMSRNATEAA